MSVKVFSTKLNSLAKCAPSMANLEKNKLDMFMKRLRLDITKDVIMNNNPPKTFLEDLSQVLRSETMTQCIVRDRELLKEIASLALM